MKLPYWPFVVHFIVRIDLPKCPTVMHVQARDLTDKTWECGIVMEADDAETIAGYFKLALLAFERAC